MVEEGTPAVATPSDVGESSRRAGEEGTQSSEEIPIGEPIIPPYNGSKVLPVARLLHEEGTAGASSDLEGEEESSDDLVYEITATPPCFEYNHDEDLEDDPQLTLGNMKKFQANVREFTKFSVLSTIVEYFFLLWMFLETDCVLLQQLVNRSYLKSQKLKETAADRRRIGLLEMENAALKKDKAALEQKVKILKEVIQKNRGNFLYYLCCGSLLFSHLGFDVLLVLSTDGTESHQKEL